MRCSCCKTDLSSKKQVVILADADSEGTSISCETANVYCDIFCLKKDLQAIGESGCIH